MQDKIRNGSGRNKRPFGVTLDAGPLGRPNRRAAADELR